MIFRYYLKEIGKTTVTVLEKIIISFFPTVKVDGEYLYTEEDAKEICKGCEVQRECLDFAVITKSDEGIFGGYTPQERKLLQDNYEKVLELQAKERNDKQ